MEREVPAVAEPQHLEHAPVRQVAADLLGHADPDVLGDLLGPAQVGQHLGDGFQDQVQVADRHALGEQQLQHGLQARIRDLARAHVVDQPLVFGVEAVEERPHVLVGQQRREVVAHDLAQVGEQDRHRVDGLETLALDLAQVGFRDPHRPHAEGGLPRVGAGHVGLAALARDHHHLAELQGLGRHHGAVDLDLVAFGVDVERVGDLDLGHHEAVLAGELAPHLDHAVAQHVLGGHELARELLPQAQLHLGGAQELLDRFLGVGERAALGRLGAGRLGGRAGRIPAGQAVAHEQHGAAQRREGEERQARHGRQDEQQERRHEQGAWEIAELAQHRLVGRAARAALGHQQARAQRYDQGGDLRHEAVAHRQLGEHVGRVRQRHAVPRHPDHDAAEDVDGQDDQARDGVAPHELGGAVHGAEEGALLLQLAAAALRLLVVDQTGRQVGVDGHLLAGDRVQGEAGPHFGDAGRALGDDQEVDGDQDREDDQPDHEVAAHHQAREAADDVARGRVALGAVGQDQPRGGDVERQPQQGRDQQHGREGREVERPLDPQRHHQDQHRQRDGGGEPEVDQEGRDRQEEDRQDANDADREADVVAALALRFGRCRRDAHRGAFLDSGDGESLGRVACAGVAGRIGAGRGGGAPGSASDPARLRAGVRCRPAFELGGHARPCAMAPRREPAGRKHLN